MYEQVGLTPLLDRAYNLTDKYICKSIANNPLIRDRISSYKSSAELDDGAHVKPKSRRTTILGIIAANKNLNCNKQPTQPSNDTQTNMETTRKRYIYLAALLYSILAIQER
jgi:hypothetical protein